MTEAIHQLSVLLRVMEQRQSVPDKNKREAKNMLKDAQKGKACKKQVHAFLRQHKALLATAA